MDKHEKRLSDIADADRSEWQRTVAENRELLAELSSLRARYGFPLRDLPQVCRWIDENPEERTRLDRDLAELIRKHEIDEKWRSPFFYLAILGWPLGLAFSLGFPTYTSDDEVIIKSDTDRTNPIVQFDMERWRRRRMLINDPPPQPMKNGDSGKDDWTLVVEWKKRHPDVSIKELAQMMSYNRVTVSRKLREFGWTSSYKTG